MEYFEHVLFTPSRWCNARCAFQW